MSKNKPRQDLVTEEMIAAVLPIGEKVLAKDLLDMLDLGPTLTKTSLAAIMRKMSEDGFLALHPRSNRANLWSRVRKPRKPRIASRPDEIGGVVIERVAIGGSTSNHHGASMDKPALVSLPKMPTLKSLEANT